MVTANAALRKAGRLNQVSYRPNDRYRKAHHREIHVTVSHRLRAYLHQTNDWNQHAQVAEPADCKVGARLYQSPCHAGNRRQDKHGS